VIDRGIEREVRRCLEPHDLSPPEYGALALLDIEPGLSNAELARRSLVTPQSMNEVIARLEQRGYVARRPSPDHGRIRLTEVTSAGSELIQRAAQDVGSFERWLLGGLTGADRARLEKLLLRVLGRLRHDGASR
jgi:DNA-binding MarR family transcriptional regulator